MHVPNPPMKTCIHFSELKLMSKISLLKVAPYKGYEGNNKNPTTYFHSPEELSLQ